jgi:outer membrane protein OmpU
MTLKKQIFAASIFSALAVFSTVSVAHAEDGVRLGISGHFKIYTGIASQDESAGTGVRTVDILRDTDMTFSGETQLANGLTVGALVNADGDTGDSFEIEDSFVYASGTWGRLSLGAEDGASFLLQVAAPAADENVDGIEAFVSPINYSQTGLAGTNLETRISSSGFSYGNWNPVGDKITYLTPVMSGFQAGVSYTPDTNDLDPVSRALDGNNPDGGADEFGPACEIGARYERELESVTFILGAGYSSVDREGATAGNDDLNEWNVGLDLDIGDYGIGAVYTETNLGLDDDGDSETFVLGADYTMGAVRYGASWLNNDREEGAGLSIDTNRFTVGAVYEYGPGLTLRSSVSHIDSDASAGLGDDVQGTALLLGTEILF